MGNGAWQMIIGPYDGTRYNEHSGTTFVTVSQILMKTCKFFVHHSNIWQSIVAHALMYSMGNSNYFDSNTCDMEEKIKVVNICFIWSGSRWWSKAPSPQKLQMDMDAHRQWVIQFNILYFTVAEDPHQWLTSGWLTMLRGTLTDYQIILVDFSDGNKILFLTAGCSQMRQIKSLSVSDWQPSGVCHLMVSWRLPDACCHDALDNFPAKIINMSDNGWPMVSWLIADAHRRTWLGGRGAWQQIKGKG